jgi:DNA-binding NtrC family response regulator
MLQRFHLPKIYMVNSVKHEMREVLLVIADTGSREYHHALAVKNMRTVVATFKEADEAVRGCHVDIILIDSGSNTEEALQILRKNKIVCPNIPNIFITNTSYEGLVLKVFRSGAYDFFREPVNIIELQETIKGILALKNTAREIRHPLVRVSTVV